MDYEREQLHHEWQYQAGRAAGNVRGATIIGGGIGAVVVGGIVLWGAVKGGLSVSELIATAATAIVFAVGVIVSECAHASKKEAVYLRAMVVHLEERLRAERR
jgi:hypothetical protein